MILKSTALLIHKHVYTVYEKKTHRFYNKYVIKLDEDAFTFNSSPQISRPS